MKGKRQEHKDSASSSPYSQEQNALGSFRIWSVIQFAPLPLRRHSEEQIIALSWVPVPLSLYSSTFPYNREYSDKHVKTNFLDENLYEMETSTCSMSLTSVLILFPCLDCLSLLPLVFLVLIHRVELSLFMTKKWNY